MAVVKHLANHSGNYQGAIDYLVFQHDEVTGRAVRDDEGNPILREEFYMDGVNCEPLSFAAECRISNRQHGKNQGKDEIKAHHYIISYDPRDVEVGLTPQEAQAMSLALAKEWFGGHQCVVFTHPDGSEGSGNIHTHIVLNSLRIKDEPERGWMQGKSWLWRAGCKHQASDKFIAELKQAVMDMCQRRGLHQVDLLSPAKADRVTEREYWSGRHLSAKRVASAAKDTGDLSRKPDGVLTRKAYVRKAVRDATATAVDFGTFAGILDEKYGLGCVLSNGRIYYKHPDDARQIKGRQLGLDYEWPVIAEAIQSRIEHGETRERLGLLVELEAAQKAMRSPAYARKVRVSNVRRLAKTIAFVQESGISSLEDLNRSCDFAQDVRDAARKALADVDAELSSVNRAIRARGAYFGNKRVVDQYRRCTDKQRFYSAHRRELDAFMRAQRELKGLFPGGEVPSMDDLKSRKEALQALRNERYESFCEARYQLREFVTARRNIEAALRPREGVPRRARGDVGLDV
ncbi:relaxase/mobilization nuclease domain-containing protein [Adlercreutzia sp. ZJ473]|uniref:relaxase/mobilization nuclease domain-containing protein n=1 Tax=Adlercreutzia sp. ZJ473 TaxID=2722822 RepID=UPI0015546134|nr:relaxase/mobilization nuclease domain-containing protein [Adlercreutzia sp. ZJ473]